MPERPIRCACLAPLPNQPPSRPQRILPARLTHRHKAWSHPFFGMGTADSAGADGPLAVECTEVDAFGPATGDVRPRVNPVPGIACPLRRGWQPGIWGGRPPTPDCQDTG